MPTQNDRIQRRLLLFAALFLLLYSLTLTLSPAGRARSWQVDYRWQHWIGLLVWSIAFMAAHRQTCRLLPERDPYLLPVVAMLSGWGLLMIYRLSPGFGLRQSLWLAASVLVLLIGIKAPSDLRFLQRYKYLSLTAGIALTGMTLFFGTNPLGLGPRLWLGCCGIYFQPSEPLKLLLIIYLAAYFVPLANHKSQVEHPHNRSLMPVLAPTFLMAGTAAAILLAQRDLGTGSILFMLYAVMLYLATERKLILLTSSLAMIAAAVIGYLSYTLVQDRIQTWLNPWSDPSGLSYQIVQSLIAAASGGLPGRGPGLGSPGLVPVAHSDFIFSAIVEESGLIGALAILCLFGLLATRGLRIAMQNTNPFQRLLAAGLSAHIVFQAIWITGGNLRLLPLTGVTLPFISYGGSSLLTTFLAVLMLLLLSSTERSVPSPASQSISRYQKLAAAQYVGLLAVALTAGWWTVYRAPALESRTDNPRRTIADRFVPRGQILDRNGQPLAYTIGAPGSYKRQVASPGLGAIIGYHNPTYGQSALEAGLDPYLRGMQGYPPLTVYWNNLLYGQPPPGLDIRLSLDMNIQQGSDRAMDGRVGALVALNAQTGEILAMASSPGFDANQLEAEWENLVISSAGPFLNRAYQGSYPAYQLINNLFPVIEDPDRITQQPQIYLPELEGTALGDEFILSPLQVALAAAALSADGLRPAPSLVTAVRTPDQGWELLPGSGQPVHLSSPASARQQAAQLAATDARYWEIVSVESSEPARWVTWYVGGTLPAWQGAPLVLVVLLEENDPILAKKIGQQVLSDNLLP